MNKTSFLKCLGSTGFNTGISVIGLYSFSSGVSGAVFNQIYDSGYNYYSGYPYHGALPLVFDGTGSQTSGKFNNNQSYQVGLGYTGNFGAFLSLTYSGCQNTSSINYLLLSSTPNFQNQNSGVVLGITPSSRLFLSISGYSQIIPKEIGIGDYAFISVEQNRFINFGLYSVTDDVFYRKYYDPGTERIKVQNLYVGGALGYPSNFTGYSGNINEIYLFNGGLEDPSIRSCFECSFATGYSYNSLATTYTGIQITGSYWTGIQQILTTGTRKISGNYAKMNGGSGVIYYDSGLSGNVTVNQLLIPQTQNVEYIVSGSGLVFSYDTGRRISGSVFNTYFDLGLVSGDTVEIYTYPSPNKNIGQSIAELEYPSQSGLIQVYGNGLAETKDVDYGVAFNNLMTGFYDDDILLYDIYSGAPTYAYITGLVSTGISSASIIRITGASGVGFSYPFQYDVYFNGQKMSTGVDYNITNTAGNSVLTSDTSSAYNLAFFDINQAQGDYLEVKFVPLTSGVIRRTSLITSNVYYVSGITGFSEQIWTNGMRQSVNIDYFKENACQFCSGSFLDPNYGFNLYNSRDDAINLFYRITGATDAPLDPPAVTGIQDIPILDA